MSQKQGASPTLDKTFVPAEVEARHDERNAGPAHTLRYSDTAATPASGARSVIAAT